MKNKTLNLIIDQQPYTLDVESAIKEGLLKEDSLFEFSFTENEVATLRYILQGVGGSPMGARGYADNILAKIGNRVGYKELKCDRNLSLDKHTTIPNKIYLAS